MKILTKLWQALKGADVNSSGWIVQQAKYDEQRNLYIVGEPKDILDPTTTLPPDHPSFRTIDSGDIPTNWHQCFYYYETKSSLPALGSSWVRCRNLAGPGFKPSFCILHAAQEAARHKKTEVEKKQTLVEMPIQYKFAYCRHGNCLSQNLDATNYCSEHRGLYTGGVPSKTELSLYQDEDDCGCYGYCERHFNNGQPRTPEQIEFDAIKEEVDWDYCSKIGWGQLRYRRNRKSIPVQAQETVHFKLELRGSRDEIDLFHAIIHLCDTDYPLDPFRPNTANPEQCKNCGGYVWANAIVTPVDIKKAAKQAGMTVKVRHYFPASTCKKKDRAANA